MGVAVHAPAILPRVDLELHSFAQDVLVLGCSAGSAVQAVQQQQYS
jgi:hypothetical protein